MDNQKKDTSRVLEPDLIVSGDKILDMSEEERKRRVVDGWGEVLHFLLRQHLRGF